MNTDVALSEMTTKELIQAMLTLARMVKSEDVGLELSAVMNELGSRPAIPSDLALLREAIETIKEIPR